MNNNLTNYLNTFLCNVKIATTNQYNFHWNIVGPFFSNIHALAESYYTELETITDEVAERIKQLNDFPITSDEEAFRTSTIKNYPSKNYSEVTAITLTIKDFEILLDMAKQIGNIVTQSNDMATIELMTKYISFLEKQLWILRSNLKKGS